MPGRRRELARDPRLAATIASAVTGVTGYLAVAVAAWTLPPAENADFLALWALLFGLFTVIGGLGLQTAASVRHRSGSTSGVRVRQLAVPLAVSLSILGVALGRAASGSFALPAWLLPAVGGLAVAGYVVQTLIMGSLAGMEQWRAYSAVVSVEGSVRLALVVAAALWFGSLDSLVAAVAAATMSWALLLATSAVRQVWVDAAAAEGVRLFLGRAAQTVVASVGPAILVVGYPALVKALVPPAAFVGSAGLLLAVLLTRGPFLVPLAVIQPLVVARAGAGDRRLRQLLGGVLLAGVFGAAVGYVVGPPVLALFGPEYRVEGWLVSLLVLDASLLAEMMLVAAICVAQSMHVRYLAAWAAAVAVAALALLVPASLDLRIALGLLAAPVAGLLVLPTSRALRLGASGLAASEA